MEKNPVINQNAKELVAFLASKGLSYREAEDALTEDRSILASAFYKPLKKRELKRLADIVKA